MWKTIFSHRFKESVTTKPLWRCTSPPQQLMKWPHSNFLGDFFKRIFKHFFPCNTAWSTRTPTIRLWIIGHAIYLPGLQPEPWHDTNDSIFTHKIFSRRETRAQAREANSGLYWNLPIGQKPQKSILLKFKKKNRFSCKLKDALSENHGPMFILFFYPMQSAFDIPISHHIWFLNEKAP